MSTLIISITNIRWTKRDYKFTGETKDLFFIKNACRRVFICHCQLALKPWLKILYLKPDRNYNGILAYIWNNIKYTETFGNFRKYAIISLLKIIFRVFSFIILIYTHIALYNVKQLHTLFKIMYLAYNWLRFITNSFEWWL